MAYKVIYKKRFNNKLNKLLYYLEHAWGLDIANEFLNKLDRRIETLKHQPFIGKPSDKKPYLRTVLITKHNKLFYKVGENRIIILNMYDTRKNPKNNPYIQ